MITKILKISLFIITYIYSIDASSQTIVNGKIIGLQQSGADRFHLFNVSNQNIIDSIVIDGDNFSFLINQTAPELYMLNVNNQKLGFSCWLQDTDSIKIIGDLDDLIVPDKTSDLYIKRVYNNLEITGSIEQNIHNSFFSSIEKPLRELLFLYYDSGKDFLIEDELKHLRENILKSLISQIKIESHSHAIQFAIYYLDKYLDIFTEQQKGELEIVVNEYIDENTPIFNPM